MLVLYRYHSNATGTQGLVLYNGLYLGDSLELPWLHNEPFVSCIPEGDYDISWNEHDHKIGPCYEVLKVKSREGILIHAANSVEQLEGCIAVGIKCADNLWNSKLSLANMHKVVGDNAKLIITSKFGA